MYVIAKDFDFAASHRLGGLPPDHPCSRLHGHNYLITLELAAAALDDTGFVYDYRALAPFKAWVDAVLDHRDLNEVLAACNRFENPSAEHLARWVFTEAQALLSLPPAVHLVAVRVKETPKTMAEYRP